MLSRAAWAVKDESAQPCSRSMKRARAFYDADACLVLPGGGNVRVKGWVGTTAR